MSGRLLRTGGPVAVTLFILLLSVAAGADPATAQRGGTGHTLTLDPDSLPPAATIEDAAWLTGRWVGEGLGAVAEVSWLPPTGGAMVGVFRLVRDGEAEFYELVTLVEEHGSLTVRLKHFGPDLVGWEEKAESVSFPLVRHDPGTLWFDGQTIRRLGEDRMRIWVALQRRGEGIREELFEYRRAGRTP